MNITTTTPMPSAGFPDAAIAGRTIRSVYIWVLVGIGVPGNLACLATVLSMHVSTATFYVALLAAADTVALLIKLLFHQLVTYQKMTTVACYFSFLAPFFSCYANWVLALICLERFCTVLFPLKKEVYFTKRRIYVSVLLLTIALAVCFAPTPYFYTDVNRTGRRCVKNQTMQKFREDFFDVFLACLYFFFPFVLIAIFTTLIIIGLQRHRRAREGISTARATTTEGGSGASDGGVERSISIMLLSAGLVFLLLILPVCLYHLFLVKLYDSAVLEEAAQSFLLYQIVTLLSDTNHAINFIVYFLSASRFRRRFVELLKRCFGCGRRGETTSKSFSSEEATRTAGISLSRTVESEGV